MHLWVKIARKRCLKCIKNLLRKWWKHLKCFFTVEWFLSMRKMILNWFTFSAFLHRYQCCQRGYKNTFSSFKGWWYFFLMEIISFYFFRTPWCCSFDYFLIYLFLMAAFRHFFLAHESHKREFRRCLSLLENFSSFSVH